MDALDKALKDAQEIEAQLNALDEKPKEYEAEVERKMRFDDSGIGRSNVLNSKFVKKHTLDELGLEELALGRMILASRGSLMPDAFEDKFQSLAEKAVKRTMTTGGTGTGAELLDTLMWNQLWQDVIDKTLVGDLFQPWIDMPSQTYELPSMANVTFYKPSGEGVAVTATDLATKKRVLTAYNVKAQVDISDEEVEDAIIAMLPEVRAILVRNGREAIDELILNADNSTGKENINYYYPTTGGDIPTDSRFLIGFDGLIHYCLDEVTGQATSLGTLDVDDFATLLGLLGKYGDNRERLAFIGDRWTLLKAIQLDDFRTVDKLGDKATLLKGQLGAVYGVPVVLSGQLQKSCATGQVHQTAENNTVGRLLLVNRDMWRFGVRRSIVVEIQRDVPKGLVQVVVHMRIALQCFGDRTSADYCHTALGFNVTV